MEGESLDIEERVCIALAAVPRGRIVSYGGLAELSQAPGRARLIGRILGRISGRAGLPWQRVVRSDGRIAMPPGSAGHRRQAELLGQEGVEVRGGRVVRPARYFWPDR